MLDSCESLRGVVQSRPPGRLAESIPWNRFLGSLNVYFGLSSSLFLRVESSGCRAKIWTRELYWGLVDLAVDFS
jgi:hypothetical protein